jgi:hypothetical protein
MTAIGMLGSGHVGTNLAQAAIARGCDVVLSNTQGPDLLAQRGRPVAVIERSPACPGPASRFSLMAARSSCLTGPRPPFWAAHSAVRRTGPESAAAHPVGVDSDAVIADMLVKRLIALADRKRDGDAWDERKTRLRAWPWRPFRVALLTSPPASSCTTRCSHLTTPRIRCGSQQERPGAAWLRWRPAWCVPVRQAIRQHLWPTRSSHL